MADFSQTNVFAGIWFTHLAPFHIMCSSCLVPDTFGHAQMPKVLKPLKDPWAWFQHQVLLVVGWGGSVVRVLAKVLVRQPHKQFVWDQVPIALHQLKTAPVTWRSLTMQYMTAWTLLMKLVSDVLWSLLMCDRSVSSTYSRAAIVRAKSKQAAWNKVHSLGFYALMLLPCQWQTKLQRLHHSLVLAPCMD